MPKKALQVSSESGVSMPIKNLISIVGAVAVGVWSYFGIVERIGKLENSKSINGKRFRVSCRVFY